LSAFVFFADKNTIEIVSVQSFGKNSPEILFERGMKGDSTAFQKETGVLEFGLS
jgi:hypothetical protein